MSLKSTERLVSAVVLTLIFLSACEPFENHKSGASDNIHSSKSLETESPELNNHLSAKISARHSQEILEDFDLYAGGIIDRRKVAFSVEGNGGSLELVYLPQENEGWVAPDEAMFAHIDGKWRRLSGGASSLNGIRYKSWTDQDLADPQKDEDYYFVLYYPSMTDEIWNSLSEEQKEQLGRVTFIPPKEEAEEFDLDGPPQGIRFTISFKDIPEDIRSALKMP